MTRPPRTMQLLVVVVGLALYFVCYFAAPLPSLARFGAAGGVPRRGTFLFESLLLFDQVVRSWFGDPFGFALSDRLPVLLIAGVILAVATSVGYLIVVFLRADGGLSRLEVVLLAIAVGLVGLSDYVLLIGLIGRLRHTWLFIVPGIAAMIAAGGQLAVRLRHATAAGTAPATIASPLPATPWLSRRWLWLTVPFLLATLLGGLLPPIEFDVREYHLEVPKEFFAAGQIGFVPHNIYGNMPLGAEMLALLGMVVSGDWWTGALVGKTIIALFLPLTGLALLAAGQRLFSPSAGVVAATLYVSIPWMVRVSTLGLIEGAYAFYLFLAVYMIVLWTRTDRSQRAASAGSHAPDQTRTADCGTILAAPPAGGRSTLLVAGLLTGGAMSCKYPAAIFVFLPLATWVFFARRRCHWRGLVLFTLAALLGSGLWFGKNLALTGNPIYPLAYQLFGGDGWSVEKDAKWRSAHAGGDLSAQNAAAQFADVTVRSEWLSPLVMPLAILAVLVPRHRRLILWLWIYFGYVIVAWWLLTHRIDRFWIPVLPIVALLAGLGATWTAAPVWRRIFVPTWIAGLAVCLLIDTSGPGGYNRYFVSYQRLRTSTERVDPWHRYLNAHVPSGHKVLLVGDAQGFDLEVPVLYNTVFDDCIFEQVARGCSADEQRRWLANQRVSHIYVHWGEIARYRSPGNYGFTEFVTPERFQALVQQGVLASPEPPFKGHPGQVYRVLF